MVAGAASPTVLVATRLISYSVPFVSPVIVPAVELAGIVIETSSPPPVGVAVSWYPVRSAPPSYVGGLQLRTARPSRGSAPVTRALRGDVAAVGTAGSEVSLGALVPAALVAVIVTVYATWAHSPGTTAPVASPPTSRSTDDGLAQASLSVPATGSTSRS